MFWLSWISVLLALPALILADEPPTELVVETTFKPESCSEVTESGDMVKMHYAGRRFSDGEEFDSSYKRGQPLEIKLGVGQVIKGWDEGLQGMCVNEKRTLTIPADKAYGSRGFGSIIPPNSVLVFDVELDSLTKGRKKDEL